MLQEKCECKIINISDSNTQHSIDYNALLPTANIQMEDIPQMKALAQKQKERQGMDVLPLDLYEQMLENSLRNGDFRTSFWLTAMSNFGLRYSDVVKLRRIDLVDEHNHIRDSVLLQEKKTSKQRVVFINDSVKMALLMLLWNGDFAPTDYLIVSKGRRMGYEVETYTAENGKQKAVRRNGRLVYKVDAFGRKIPKPLSRCQSEKIMKDIIVENLGYALKNDRRCIDTPDVIYKISTHSIRKLYGKAVTDAFIRNFDSDLAYAHAAALSFLSQDFGHSSEAMTLHYSKDFEELKRQINMQMNLGIEVLRPYFEAEKEKFLSKG